MVRMIKNKWVKSAKNKLKEAEMSTKELKEQSQNKS